MITDQGELLPVPQYVAIKFNDWDYRSYTYENPHKAVKVGDVVRVNTDDGVKAVKVVSIVKTPPKFKCKQIVKPEE